MSTPAKPKSAKAKAIDYATNVIGVDSVFTEAQKAADDAASAHDGAVAERHLLREAEAGYADWEADFLAELAATEAGQGMSATAFKEHAKASIAQNEDGKAWRTAIRECRLAVDSAESNAKSFTLQANVLSARMAQQGGLLNFYANAGTPAPKA